MEVKWVFTLASTAMVLSNHLPQPGIRTPDLPVLFWYQGFYPLGYRVVPCFLNNDPLNFLKSKKKCSNLKRLGIDI